MYHVFGTVCIKLSAVLTKIKKKNTKAERDSTFASDFGFELPSPHMYL